jgi:hypothetical protein
MSSAPQPQVGQDRFPDTLRLLFDATEPTSPLTQEASLLPEAPSVLYRPSLMLTLQLIRGNWSARNSSNLRPTVR